MAATPHPQLCRVRRQAAATPSRAHCGRVRPSPVSSQASPCTPLCTHPAGAPLALPPAATSQAKPYEPLLLPDPLQQESESELLPFALDSDSAAFAAPGAASGMAQGGLGAGPGMSSGSSGLGASSGMDAGVLGARSMAAAAAGGDRDAAVGAFIHMLQQMAPLACITTQQTLPAAGAGSGGLGGSGWRGDGPCQRQLPAVDWAWGEVERLAAELEPFVHQPPPAVV